MKTNPYAHLIGKEVNFIYEDGTTLIAIVVGIHPDIGVTMVNKEDTENKLCCINKDDYPPDIEFFDIEFNFTVDAIKKGEIRLSDVLTLYDDYNQVSPIGLGEMAECAFQ